jgi:hypothetical protein
MSAKAIDEIIGLTVTDAEFRKRLVCAPEQPLDGYELSDEERQALLRLGRGLRRRHGSTERARANIQGQLSFTGFDSPGLRDANHPSEFRHP